jgi:hypothetical protein
MRCLVALVAVSLAWSAAAETLDPALLSAAQVEYKPVSELEAFPTPVVKFVRAGLATDEERARIKRDYLAPLAAYSPVPIAAFVVEFVKDKPWTFAVVIIWAHGTSLSSVGPTGNDPTSATAWLEEIQRGMDNADGECGWARHVAQFTIEHGEKRYTLPASVKIQKADITLFEDESTSEWRPPYSGVEFSSFGQYLLVKTYKKDCADLYGARLFVVLPNGSVIHQPVWTSNWRAGFFVAKGELTYWSEWFCRDPERGETSYVYVLSESDKRFVRREVSESLYCKGAAEPEYLEFEPAEASP